MESMVCMDQKDSSNGEHATKVDYADNSSANVLQFKYDVVNSVDTSNFLNRQWLLS